MGLIIVCKLSVYVKLMCISEVIILQGCVYEKLVWYEVYRYFKIIFIVFSLLKLWFNMFIVEKGILLSYMKDLN